MGRKNTRKSEAEILEDRQARQAGWFPEAAKVMNTPLGRALRKPGVTFRYWSNSSPANVWVESKRGTQLFHSDESNHKCPVKNAFQALRCFLDEVDHDMGSGGQAFVLSSEFIAKIDNNNLDAATPPAKNSRRAGPRL